MIDKLRAALSALESKYLANSGAWVRERATSTEGLRSVIAEMEEQQPVAWGAFYFGGKNNGNLYVHCKTKAEIDDYIGLVHQSSDSITLRAAPLYLHPQPKADQRITALESALRQAREALESCSQGDYSTGHVIDPSFDEDLVNAARTAIDALGVE
jgi:hypothetical protein